MHMCTDLIMFPPHHRPLREQGEDKPENAIPEDHEHQRTQLLRQTHVTSGADAEPRRLQRSHRPRPAVQHRPLREPRKAEPEIAIPEGLRHQPTINSEDAHQDPGADNIWGLDRNTRKRHPSEAPAGSKPTRTKCCSRDVSARVCSQRTWFGLPRIAFTDRFERDSFGQTAFHFAAERACSSSLQSNARETIKALALSTTLSNRLRPARDPGVGGMQIILQSHCARCIRSSHICINLSFLAMFTGIVFLRWSEPD